jgi:hypothetical protein
MSSVDRTTRRSAPAGALFAAAVALWGLSGAGVRASAASAKKLPVVHPIPQAADIRVALDEEYHDLAWYIYRLQSGRWVRNYRERFGKRDLNLRGLVEEQAYDRNALVLPGDPDPLAVVLRRAGALLDHHRTHETLPKARLDAWRKRLAALAAQAKPIKPKTAWKDCLDAQRQAKWLAAMKEQNRTPKKPPKKIPVVPDPRRDLFYRACALRREVVLANPLLDFDAIVCMLEQPGIGRIMEQGRACWGTRPRGGGPAVLTGFRGANGKPKIRDVLASARVANGRWKGKKLTGAFAGLELSYDGTFLLFAATTDTMVWHVFRYGLETKKLEQLTDGPHDDFDPHELPSGRIVFTSTRRGGLGRCNLPPQSATYTLHSMAPDGSDIVMLSFHETNEWRPAVGHDGMIVYTRWDYVDRFWGSAHHMWTCFPDGRNPRNLHGNYPVPRSAFPPGAKPSDYGRYRDVTNGRHLRPDAEMGFRPIPGSHRFTATAVGHHEGFSGSLILVDPSVPDDGKMSQVRRITPEVLFPECEQPNRYAGGHHWWGTAWPLNEDFYLCNHRKGLYVLDRFGNREVLYHTDGGPFRVRDPFPLRARSRPPVLATATWQGKRRNAPGHRRATIQVANCYIADTPLPPGVKVKWMRIVQVIPQLRSRAGYKPVQSLISWFDDSVGRMPLGVVPVEEDGSVYCEAPVDRALYFQLLDEQGMAVHSMRSITYVHPGEQLACVGCHEARHDAPPAGAAPSAFRRPPSKIRPEVASGAIPFNFEVLVRRPVFNRKCLPCHRKYNKKFPPKYDPKDKSPKPRDLNAGKRAPDLSYGSLRRRDLILGMPGEKNCIRMIGMGGSRTTPGKVGADASGLMLSLRTRPQHKGVLKSLSKDDLRRITLWLDLNSNRICWIDESDSWKAQFKGELLNPPIDFDPKNPLGVESDRPLPDAAGS